MDKEGRCVQKEEKTHIGKVGENFNAILTNIQLLEKRFCLFLFAESEQCYCKREI